MPLHAIRVLLSLVVLVMASGKLLTGYPEHSLLPPSAFYLIGVVELIAGGLLIANKFKVSAALVVCVIGVAGVIIAMTSEVPCGCLGKAISLSRANHLMLASTLAAIASTYLFLLFSAESRRAAGSHCGNSEC